MNFPHGRALDGRYVKGATDDPGGKNRTCGFAKKRNIKQEILKIHEKIIVENSVENVDNFLHLLFTAKDLCQAKFAALWQRKALKKA